MLPPPTPLLEGEEGVTAGKGCGGKLGGESGFFFNRKFVFEEQRGGRETKEGVNMRKEIRK